MNAYNQADQRLHVLSQLLTKVNRRYVPKKEDDSHTNLSFDGTRKRLFGRWIRSANQSVIASIATDTLEFNWLDNRFEALCSIGMVGKTMVEIERELILETQALGFNTDGLVETLHFSVPTYGFEQRPIEALSREAVDQWCNLRSLANQACFWLLSHTQRAGEIRIWPHHFDTGTFVNVHKHLGIGFGLAMTDTMVDQPYVYLSGYAESPIDYGSFSALKKGYWEIGESWKGAVLPVQELLEPSFSSNQETLQEFIKDAVFQVLSIR